MAGGESKKKVSIKEGLFKPPDNGEAGHLIGSKCKQCGECFHPKRVVCPNCYSEDMEEVALSKRGKIYTYTIGRVAYPGRPVKAPFISAQIDLPEKVRVLGLVTDLDPNEIEIGDEVELYFWKTGEDDQGNEVTAYAFRPVSKSFHAGR